MPQQGRRRGTAPAQGSLHHPQRASQAATEDHDPRVHLPPHTGVHFIELLASRIFHYSALLIGGLRRSNDLDLHPLALCIEVHCGEGDFIASRFQYELRDVAAPTQVRDTSLERDLDLSAYLYLVTEFEYARCLSRHDDRLLTLRLLEYQWLTDAVSVGEIDVADKIWRVREIRIPRAECYDEAVIVPVTHGDTD